jgi:hypothetical protein
VQGEEDQQMESGFVEKESGQLENAGGSFIRGDLNDGNGCN